MGEVVRFITRAELERARLRRESRTPNDNALPQIAALSAPQDPKNELLDN
jgi:hypothetical protein